MGSATSDVRDEVAAGNQDPQAGVARALRPLLVPQSVAVIGASRTPSSLGRRVLDALVAGGFGGPIYPVNAEADEIAGRRCFRSVRDLPPGVDLAVVAVPAGSALAVVEEAIAAGVGAFLVITAGFAETGEAGRHLQDELVARVRHAGVRMVGPNCMGLINPAIHLNASFSPVLPPPGPVAFSSQSGALGLTILELARDRGIGISAFVSVGNKADISSNDLIEYWETDPATSVILLYLESFGNPRKFAEIARRVGRTKPIIAVKAGRTGAGRRAATSHTAALAATDSVVDALFHSTGVIRAETIDELFDLASCLSTQALPSGRRVAVITNAGGPGILAVDACERAGLSVVEFSDHTRRKLAAFLSASASLGNPVDMVASAGGDDYRRAIEVVLSSDEVDALAILYTPVDPVQSASTLDGVRAGIKAARAAGHRKPVVACLMADAAKPKPLEVGDERIPTYAFPENAVRALSKAAAYAEWRQLPAGRLSTFADTEPEAARGLVAGVVAARGTDWLTGEELQRLFSAYRLPATPGVVSADPDDAASLAETMGFPVVLKISAQRLVHKSDIHGVRTDLRTAAEVREAANELLAVARTHQLDAEGVLVQQMVTDGVETMIGLAHDPLFGAVLGFGLGGTDVELERDVHFAVVPITDRDADDLVDQSRALPRLVGYRGRPKADVAALHELLLRVSQLASDIPQVLEIDLNPVIIRPRGMGCAIVDARVRVGPVARKARSI